MNLKNFKVGLTINLLGTAIVTIQAIWLAPIYIKDVGQPMYGAWIVLADLFVALQFFDFGITSYSAQKIASARASEEVTRQVANFYASLCLILASICVLAMLVGFGLKFVPLPSELSGEQKDIILNCLLIGAAAVAIQLSGFCFIAVSRALEDMLVVNITSLIGILIGFIVALTLVEMGAGLYAAAFGMLARTSAATCGAIYSFSKRREAFGWKLLDRRELRFALLDQLKQLPVTASGNLSVLAIASCENFIVGSAVGLRSVAIYSVSKKLFDFVRTIVDLYSYNAFGGLASAMASQSVEARKRYIAHHLRIVTMFVFVICVGAYSVNEYFVSVWVGEKMYFGALANIALAAGVFCGCLSGFMFGVLRALGRFEGATKLSLVELSIKVSVMAFIIPILGLSGVGVGILVAGFVMVLFGLRLIGLESSDVENLRRTVLYGLFLLFIAIIGEITPWAIARFSIKLCVILAVLYCLYSIYAILKRGGGESLSSTQRYC